MMKSMFLYKHPACMIMQISSGRGNLDCVGGHGVLWVVQ